MAEDFLGGTVMGMRPGTNPVARVQLIVYNAFSAEWKQRKQNAGNAKYGGPVDHDHMMALDAEPMVYERTAKLIRYTGSLDRETTLRLFTCLNGYGRKGETKNDILRRLRWGGFKGYKTLEDKNEMYTQIDFPSYFGGLFSIINNGDETIFQGDYLYWDIPEDEKEAREIISKFKLEGRLSGARGDRRTVFVRPYDPRKQSVNKYQLRRVSDMEPGDYLEAARNKRGHFDKTLTEVFESIKALIGIGIIIGRGNPDETELDDIKTIEEAKTAISAAFLGQEGSDASLKGFFERADPRRIETVSRHILTQAVIQMIAPIENTEFYNQRDLGNSARYVKIIQKGNMNGKDDVYPNLLERFLKNTIECESHVKGRIIARAMSPANPGQSLDIIAIP